MADDPESQRLVESRERGVPWRKWGPYLSERQWGTVREDYSDNGPIRTMTWSRRIRRARATNGSTLLDTGVFDDNRYFDVVVEYAKAAPEDILMRITVVNRGPDAALLHVLPTRWFRDVWSAEPNEPRPILRWIASG